MLLADDSFELAYPLRRTLSEVPGSTVVDWHDAALRPVRVETWCIQHAEGQCVRKAIFWQREGFVADLGLDVGYDLVAGRPMVRTFMGTPVTMAPEIERSGSSITVTFGPQSFPGLPEAPFTGSMKFPQGKVFPERVQLAWPTVYDIDLTLVSADESPRRTFIDLDATGFTHEASLAGPELLLFTGEQDDQFHIGYTHRQILDHFISERPHVRATLASDGCLTSYGFEPVEPQPLLTNAFFKWLVAEVRIMVLHGNGTQETWLFGVYDDPTGLRLVERSHGTDLGPGWTCEEAFRAPAPAYDIAAFLVRSSALVGTHGGSYGFTVGRAPTEGERARPEAGWTTYSQTFREVPGTEGHFPTPYAIVMDAETQRWRYGSFHPADVGSPD